MMMPLSLLCGLDPFLSQRSWAFELEMPRFLPVIVSSNSPTAAKAQRTPPSKPAMRLPSGRASLHVSGCHTLSYWIEQFVSIGLQLAKLKILLDWGGIKPRIWRMSAGPSFSKHREPMKDVGKPARATRDCWPTIFILYGYLQTGRHQLTMLLIALR